MKRMTVLLLNALTTICLLASCSTAQQLPANGQPLSAEKKILIVYLSRTNNTKAIAEIIHQKVGGRMVALGKYAAVLQARDNFNPPKLELYAEAQINFGVICMHNGVNCTAPVPTCS